MTPDPLPPEKTGPEIQRDVQRLMGRCLIRIQQYEQLLKAVLAHHEIAGTVETLQAQPTLRAEKLSGQPLGNLVKQMFESLVVPEGYESDLLTDISEFQIAAGKVYLSPIIDCPDGMVVSWTIGTSPDAERVNTMLDATIEAVTETCARPVVHSDSGGHYR